MFHTNVINQLTHWIEDNLHEPLNIKTVALRSGYSPWHLQRMFKSITGYPLASYIRIQRLNNAASELKKSRVTVADIAAKYQFDSQQSFCRAFKKYFATSPSHYRRFSLTGRSSSSANNQ